MLKVCSGVTNEKEKDGGTRCSVELLSEGPRVTGAPLGTKHSSMCSWFEPGGSVLVNLIDLMNLE